MSKSFAAWTPRPPPSVTTSTAARASGTARFTCALYAGSPTIEPLDPLSRAILAQRGDLAPLGGGLSADDEQRATLIWAGSF